MRKRFVAFLLVVSMVCALASECVPVYADNGGYSLADIAEFSEIATKAIISGVRFFKGLFDEHVCSGLNNPTGKHSFKEQVISDTGFGGRARVSTHYICEYCGKDAGEVLKEVEQAAVADLPAQGITKDGHYLLELSGHDYYMVDFVNGGDHKVYCDHHETTDTDHVDNVSFDEDNGLMLVHPDSGASTISVYCFESGWSITAPVSGYYNLDEDYQCFAIRGGTSDYYPLRYYYKAWRSSLYYNEGETISFYVDTIGKRVTNNRGGQNPSSGTYGSTAGVSVQVFSPHFVVQPFAGLINVENDTTYNINTRVTNITGNFGVINNNEITKLETTYIVNESSNKYFSPATGMTYDITDWRYDYPTRTYIITVDGGEGEITVTYGDECITIVENGETYYIYYLLPSSSSGGTDTPDTPYNPPAPVVSSGVFWDWAKKYWLAYPDWYLSVVDSSVSDSWHSDYLSAVQLLPFDYYNSLGAFEWIPSSEKHFHWFGGSSQYIGYDACPDASNIDNWYTEAFTTYIHDNQYWDDNDNMSGLPCKIISSAYFSAGYYDVAPISGDYARVKSILGNSYRDDSPDAVVDTLYYPDLNLHYTLGDSVYATLSGTNQFSSLYTGVSYNVNLSWSFDFFAPVYSITPDDDDLTYSSDSRPASISGLLATSTENGLSLISADRIFSEEDMKLYIPSQKEYVSVDSWEYDYATRAYSLTSGEDSYSVIFGDDNLSIVLPDESTETVYYVVNTSNPDITEYADSFYSWWVITWNSFETWWKGQWSHFRNWYSNLSFGGQQAESVNVDELPAYDNTDWDFVEDEQGGDGSIMMVIRSTGGGIWKGVKMLWGHAVNVFNNLGKTSEVYHDAFDNDSENYAFSYFTHEGEWDNAS